MNSSMTPEEREKALLNIIDLNLKLSLLVDYCTEFYFISF